MKSSIPYFTSSFVVTILAVMTAFYFAGLAGAITVIFLTVLETSLSFDNAVVNAGILKNWDAVWRRRFLTWGILIAVFGMRLVFPLAIVAVAGEIGPVRVIDLAFNHPDEYKKILSSAHHQIAAFGGAFLMMVFLSFFVAKHKTEHWLEIIEKPLTRLGQMQAIEAALTLLILLLVASIVAPELRAGFVVAGVWGLITFVLAKGLASLLGGEDEGAGHVVKQGIAGFLYLELIDASFSFDGVIGAFAITNNLLIIVLGLGAGAMFVRSFTILLVDKGTLTEYRYLEHGAFWAIGALAILMLVGVSFHISEAITGLLGGALIVAALGSSILANRRDAKG
jgi:uncharacterized protein